MSSKKKPEYGTKARPRMRGATYSIVFDKILLQPWFLPKRVATAIHSLVPSDFSNKMAYFYEDYGCMICGRDTEEHFSNGMCRRCNFVIRGKLIASVKRRLKTRSRSRLDLVLFRQERLATKLLARFRQSRGAASQNRRFNVPGRNNPVYEALCARVE